MYEHGVRRFKIEGLYRRGGGDERAGYESYCSGGRRR